MVDSGSPSQIIDRGCIDGSEVKRVYTNTTGEEEEDSGASMDISMKSYKDMKDNPHYDQDDPVDIVIVTLIRTLRLEQGFRLGWCRHWTETVIDVRTSRCISVV